MFKFKHSVKRENNDEIAELKEKMLQMRKEMRTHNCLPTGRQKGSHAQFPNTETGAKTIFPMHNEIDDILAKKICKQLGIPVVGNN